MQKKELQIATNRANSNITADAIEAKTHRSRKRKCRTNYDYLPSVGSAMKYVRHILTLSYFVQGVAHRNDEQKCVMNYFDATFQRLVRWLSRSCCQLTHTNIYTQCIIYSKRISNDEMSSHVKQQFVLIGCWLGSSQSSKHHASFDMPSLNASFTRSHNFLISK